MSPAQAIPSPAGRDARHQRAAGLAARAAEIALVLVIAWLAAQALWFIVYGAEARRMDIAPAGTGGASTAAVRDLSALETFTVFASRGRPEAATAAQAPETRLNLTLRGVRTGASPLDGSAVIEAPGQGQRALAAGAQIADGVRLVEIHPDRVIINRRGARETIFLREEARRNARAAAAPRPAAGPAAAAQAAGPTRDAASFDPDAWIDGLRLEPVLDGATMRGLRVRDASRAELLNAAGLQAGDVITRVNGVALDGAAAARTVAQSFQSAGDVRLEIERDGAPVSLTIPLGQGG
ncbi:MAG: type II secretion system protein N [Oceanicaulis sp.]